MNNDPISPGTLLEPQQKANMDTFEEQPVKGEWSYLDGALYMIDHLSLYYNDLITGKLSPFDFVGKSQDELYALEHSVTCQQIST